MFNHDLCQMTGSVHALNNTCIVQYKININNIMLDLNDTNLKECNKKDAVSYNYQFNTISNITSITIFLSVMIKYAHHV